MKRQLKKKRTFTLLLLLFIGFSIFSCSKTVYVRQNGTTYNDYEAMKSRRVEKKDSRKPKTYVKKQNW
jgi:hypothetical protein